MAGGRVAGDAVIDAIVDYVVAEADFPEAAWRTARLDFLDSLGCALLALDYPACRRVLGPVVPGAEPADGVAVPGTPWRLDPVTAAFSLGAMVRWLDYNDTWLAAEWGHPSDNLGGILALAAWVARRRRAAGESPPTLRDVLAAQVRAHEIQGVLALENAFNAHGLDHVLLVRVATAAVAAALLGCDAERVRAAVSNAWLDGGALRTYRHAPNTGARKSWAAGDATARGVWLALMAERGEPGYATPLGTPGWGFQDALLGGREIVLARPLASYVMEHVLFKIAFPAEFHAQTAVEAAFALHPQVHAHLDAVEHVEIETQEAGARIIDKTGPLHNPADRDHCIQYMTAVGLISGELTAADYEDERAADARIDALRARMTVQENPEFTAAYHDAARRAIPNAVRVHFSDGTATERVRVDYPVGHPRRRDEGVPLLLDKYRRNVAGRLPAAAERRALAWADAPGTLDAEAADAACDALAAGPDFRSR